MNIKYNEKLNCGVGNKSPLRNGTALSLRGRPEVGRSNLARASRNGTGAAGIKNRCLSLFNRSVNMKNHENYDKKLNIGNRAIASALSDTRPPCNVSHRKPVPAGTGTFALFVFSPIFSFAGLTKKTLVLFFLLSPPHSTMQRTAIGIRSPHGASATAQLTVCVFPMWNFVDYNLWFRTIDGIKNSIVAWANSPTIFRTSKFFRAVRMRVVCQRLYFGGYCWNEDLRKFQNLFFCFGNNEEFVQDDLSKALSENRKRVFWDHSGDVQCTACREYLPQAKAVSGSL